MQRARNLPQVKEETSLLSSGATTPLDEQTIHNERVAHQRICNSQIREKVKAGVPDQGIVFNEHKHPRDIRPEQGILRNNPVLTSGRSQDRRGDTPRDRRRAEGQSGGPPGGTPGGGGDSDDDNGLSHSEDEEDGGSEAPSDEEEDVEGTLPETGATPSRRNTRNTPCAMNYNVPYRRSHTAELDAYKDRGNP
jgi:hypothetical protein